MKAYISEKNRQSWNDYAEAYARHHHSAGMLSRILEDPVRAFHREVWALMRQYVPSMAGRSVCVPSSGDNLAVFAFALLGLR